MELLASVVDGAVVERKLGFQGCRAEIARAFWDRRRERTRLAPSRPGIEGG